MESESGHVPDSRLEKRTGSAFLNNVLKPNGPIRAAGEALLPQVEWAGGTAEATGLGDMSIDAWFAAQAFHWFDPLAARREALRVLKRDACGAILVWNQRRLDGTPFHAAYEALLIEFGIDYGLVRHDHIDVRRLDDFFGPHGSTECRLENAQRLDRDGHVARLKSSSYMPSMDHPRFGEMFSVANSVFERFQSNGIVEFEYDVRVLHGPLR